jgi:phosphatidylglycerol:prolipoprotein diacylglycerol transferase
VHPEIFKIPFINLSIQSFGTMMVVGFLVALWVMRRMAGHIKLDPERISNMSLYALIAGLVGAKFFYYVHHHDQFAGNFMAVFSGWGFELLGGVAVAVAFLLFYFRRKKLPAWQCLDILAVGILIGVGFGRIGCLLNGCCYGHMTESVIGIRFPYDSIVYNSQVRPDPDRNRTEPYLKLDDDFFGYVSPEGTWIPARPDEKYQANLKPWSMLTDKQKELVAGPYRCRKVLPTQPIETGYTFLLAATMYFFWKKKAIHIPGLTMATVTWIYGVLRFINEGLRDDNPFEYAWWAVYRGGTISQNMSIYMIAAGIILTIWLIIKSPACKRQDKKQPYKR